MNDLLVYGTAWLACGAAGIALMIPRKGLPSSWKVWVLGACFGVGTLLASLRAVVRNPQKSLEDFQG